MSPHSIAQSEIEPVKGGGWRVKKAITFECPELGTKTEVEEGFPTDLASIPSLFWWLIGHPAEGEFQDAAIEHDRRCVAAWKSGIYEARVVADSIFFYKLRQSQVPTWKRTAMFFAVRVWAWITYWKPFFYSPQEKESS